MGNRPNGEPLSVSSEHLYLALPTEVFDAVIARTGEVVRATAATAGFTPGVKFLVEIGRAHV